MQLPITLGTAAVLGLLFVFLGTATTAQRIRSRTGLGLDTQTDDAVPSALLIAVRRHAHFAEYVPHSLILLGLLEAWGLGRLALLGFSGALVLARLLLAVGINTKTPNPLRLAGNMLQWGLILAESGTGLWLVFAR